MRLYVRPELYEHEWVSQNTINGKFQIADNLHMAFTGIAVGQAQFSNLLLRICEQSKLIKITCETVQKYVVMHSNNIF